MATAFTFRERPYKSTVFVATVRPTAEPPRNTIESGDDVKLYVDEVAVFVRILQALGGDGFSGTIIGANAPKVDKYSGLQPGATISFAEKHIFTCSKRH
ncbi:MAG: hypothetical protein H0V44_10500 [Planctomycetes bacterium]|nr:hypothetical protein [Planctomycetota bacterium]